MNRSYGKKLIYTFLCIFLLSLIARAQPQQTGVVRPENIQNEALKGQNEGAKAEIYYVGFLAMVGKEKRDVEVTLQFLNDRVAVSDEESSKLLTEITYASITQMSYELGKRHRWAEAAFVSAVATPVAGMVVAATKNKSHWLAVEYKESDQEKMAILHLYKSEYTSVINAFEARTGKKVEMSGERGTKVLVTQDSKNVDKTVDYDIDRVRVAVKQAMEEFGCSISKENKTEVQCKRAWGETVQELYGVGGEKVTAKLDAKSNQTRIRINTGKGLLGRVVKRNWSTPIFNEMIKILEAYKHF